MVVTIPDWLSIFHYLVQDLSVAYKCGRIVIGLCIIVTIISLIGDQNLVNHYFSNIHC
jgi:hypothetical protein